MSRPLISLCLIARDEAQRLPRCLASVAPLVDEILVVDTGSTDATCSVAKRHGARVVRIPWTDDFSAARNAALAQAHGKYVLVLDADEWLLDGPEPGSFRKMISAADHEALTVELVDQLDDGAERHYHLVRLFRNRDEHRYTGTVHEQITPSIARRLGVAEIEAPPSGLVVGHDGYQEASRVAKNKSWRNVELLRSRVGADPDDAHARYFLARERVPILGGRAVPGTHLLESLDQLQWLAERTAALASGLETDARRLHAAALLALERFDEAAEVLERCVDRGVACELLRADAEMLRPERDADRIARALDRIRDCFDRPTRDSGLLAEPALAGPIARARAAEALWLLGRLDQARELVEIACPMRGAGATPWNVGAAVFRAQGRTVDALRSYMNALRANGLDPWAWAGLGELLLVQGDAAEAVEPLSRCARLAPGWDRVDEMLVAACMIADRSDDALRLFADRERATDEEHGAGARAALLLDGLNRGDVELRAHVFDPAVRDAVQRILERLARSGNSELLTRVGRAVESLERAYSGSVDGITRS